jgi:F-type H+-transporting ATPase subunit alpha
MLEEKGAMAYTIIVAANASDPAPMQVYSFRRCNWRIF